MITANSASFTPVVRFRQYNNERGGKGKKKGERGREEIRSGRGGKDKGEKRPKYLYSGTGATCVVPANYSFTPSQSSSFPHREFEVTSHFCRSRHVSSISHMWLGERNERARRIGGKRKMGLREKGALKILYPKKPTL
jgi:hypothetical protein